MGVLVMEVVVSQTQTYPIEFTQVRLTNPVNDEIHRCPGRRKTGKRKRILLGIVCAILLLESVI